MLLQTKSERNHLFNSGAGRFNTPILLSSSDAASKSARSSMSGFGHLLCLSASLLKIERGLARNERDLATRDCAGELSVEEGCCGFSYRKSKASLNSDGPALMLLDKWHGIMRWKGHLQTLSTQALTLVGSLFRSNFRNIGAAEKSD